MHKPVRSPYGHVYEQDTILKWLEKNGNICPFTGKSLNKNDLKQDIDLEKEISQWQVQRLMNMNVFKADKEDDLYSF